MNHDERNRYEQAHRERRMDRGTYFGRGDLRSEAQKDADEAEDRLHTIFYNRLNVNPSNPVGAFYVWWKGDENRRICTLQQAAVAYIQTFPGRLTSLLIELIDTHAKRT